MDGNAIRCSITVRGRVASHWSEWLGELDVSQRSYENDGEVTVLTGTVADQSALQGLLKRIWNLNFTVISVSTSTAEPSGPRDV